MTGPIILAIFDGLVSLIELSAKEIEAAVARGEISIEDQLKLKERLDALRVATAFDGPEWKIDPPTDPVQGS